MFQTLLILASLSAPPQAPTPPQAPPVKAYDPYGHDSYRNFELSILIGVGRGKLAVGVPDPWVNTYENHCRVESGVLPGIADGLWECYRDKVTGKAMMVPFAPLKPMEASASVQVLNAVGNLVKYCTKSGCYYVPAK